MRDKISIIIPVYNVEKYLKRCLESIVNQTYKNIEIILVNDGSTDNSKEICEKYAEKDPRIIVLNQVNGGSSIARNTGLDNATGEIISFIDSDDHIDKSMLEIMAQNMIEYDLDVVEIQPTKSENSTNKNTKIVIEDKITATKRVIKSTAFAVWRRIYKKSLVNDMRFIPKIIHQDVFYTIDVLNRISALGYIESPLYIYNNESVSIIRSKYTKHKIEIGIKATEYIAANTIDNSDVQKIVDNYVIYYYTDHYFLLSRNTHIDPDKTYRKKLKSEISKRLNNENRKLRAILVTMLPTKLMEIISHSNQVLKAKIKNF